MSIDLAAALRRVKPEKHLKRLEARPVDQLISAESLKTSGRLPLLPDTNVYVMSAAGTLPSAVAGLLDRSLLFLSAVCVSELATGLANIDPASTRRTAIFDHYRVVVSNVPETRVLTPDDSIWVEAGIISGTLARTQDFQRHQRKECLNDALICLTAANAGFAVLTANRTEFDLIQQLAPRGRFVYF